MTPSACCLTISRRHEGRQTLGVTEVISGALVAGPGEDGAAGAEGDRGADREVGAADDADHEGAVIGGTVGLDVEDGVVAVVAVGRHPAR